MWGEECAIPSTLGDFGLYRHEPKDRPVDQNHNSKWSNPNQILFSDFAPVSTSVTSVSPFLLAHRRYQMRPIRSSVASVCFVFVGYTILFRR